METDWIGYNCKSGQILFVYNKVTGQHKWPAALENGVECRIMQGHPVIYKEFATIATQTNDYGCNNGCMSMYINTDPSHASNISKVALPQPQPSVSDEDSLDSELGPENSLEDEDGQQDKDQTLEKNTELSRVIEETQFPSGNNLIEKNNGEEDGGNDNTAYDDGDNDDTSAADDDEAAADDDEAAADDDEAAVDDDDNTDDDDDHDINNADDNGENNDTEFQVEIRLHERNVKHSGKKRYGTLSGGKKIFTRRSHLNDHFRKQTGEKKPFECSVCKITFARKWPLIRHSRLHTGEKPFECFVCQKKFAQKGHFNRHCRLHTGEKRFECFVCHKKFAQKEDLNKHCRSHTGEKPFECFVCQKKFAQRGSLNRHCRVHTREKPY